MFPGRKASKEDKLKHTKAMVVWKEKNPEAYKKHKKEMAAK